MCHMSKSDRTYIQTYLFTLENHDPHCDAMERLRIRFLSITDIF